MRKKINRDPLRKIVGTVKRSLGDDGEFEYLVDDELLECGHAFTPREDMYGGPTNAVRRRCPECGKLGIDKLPTPAQIKIIEKLADGFSMTALGGREPCAFLSRKNSNGLDSVPMGTVMAIVRAGWVEDIEPKDMRWRSSKYVLSELGKKVWKLIKSKDEPESEDA